MKISIARYYCTSSGVDIILESNDHDDTRRGDAYVRLTERVEVEFVPLAEKPDVVAATKRSKLASLRRDIERLEKA